MKSLRHFHPTAVCVYMGCVLLPVTFGINPVTAGIGLAAGMLLWLLLDEGRGRRSVLFYVGLPILSGVINPIFNHNGVTVLFFLNGNPVTGEAVLNGTVLGLVISAALLWARCFTAVMDTDRLLCVTGVLSPRLSLVLSIVMVYSYNRSMYRRYETEMQNVLNFVTAQIDIREDAIEHIVGQMERERGLDRAAAIACINRELGGKWAFGVVVFQCVVAWVCAFLVYSIGMLLGFA